MARPPEIDFVFTYVHGTHPAWVSKYAAACAAAGREFDSTDIRHRDHGELGLAVRLVRLHCPWARRVYVVHAGEGLSPATATELEGVAHLHVVAQDALLPASVPRPCFNSLVVERYLHQLPGLSPVFVYCNDDMFVGRPLSPAHFVTAAGRVLSDVSAVPRAHRWAVPNLAARHSLNAGRAFAERYDRPLPLYRVSHFPTALCKATCKAVADAFATSLPTTQFRAATDVNFVLLVALHALLPAHQPRLWLRSRAHLPGCAGGRPMAWAFVERGAPALAWVLQHMPHRFCLNGLTEADESEFQAWKAAYLDASQAALDAERWPLLAVGSCFPSAPEPSLRKAVGGRR